MPTLLHDLRDLLAFDMLSRHTLEILRHKHAANEGQLFSALMQVLREHRKGPPQYWSVSALHVWSAGPMSTSASIAARFCASPMP
jgi:lipopolysaccharide biosynthesis protein